MIRKVGIRSVQFPLSNVAFVVFIFSVFSDNPFFPVHLIFQIPHGSAVTGLAYW